MTVATRRNLDATRDALVRWFHSRAGATNVAVTNLAIPKAGFSNETVFCDVEWSDSHGAFRRESLVLRIEPTRHQLFLSADALLQAEVLRALRVSSDLPVPRVRFVEDQPQWFGAPFYLMERVYGRVPSDAPSWHHAGWVADLSPIDRSRMYDQALQKLVGLHQLDWRGGFPVLGPPPGRTPMEAYLDRLADWAQWADADIVTNRTVILTGLDYVNSTRPAASTTGLVWGDARVGNMIFGDDLSVVALIDWERATVGPAGIDVGWWLMFEEYLCEASGLRRLEGIPDRDAILDRYEVLAGSPVPDVEYFEVLAALEFSLINSRLATLLRSLGYDEAASTRYVTRSTSLLQRGLARVNGRP